MTIMAYNIHFIQHFSEKAFYEKLKHFFILINKMRKSTKLMHVRKKLILDLFLKLKNSNLRTRLNGTYKYISCNCSDKEHIH